MFSLIPEPQKILTPDAPLDVVVIVVSELNPKACQSQKRCLQNVYTFSSGESEQSKFENESL